MTGMKGVCVGTAVVKRCVPVSSCTGEDKGTQKTLMHARSLSLSQESSPTSGVCPGLSRLMIGDIIEKASQLHCRHCVLITDPCLSCEIGAA